MCLFGELNKGKLFLNFKLKTLIKFGTLYPHSIKYNFEPWRLFTSLFISSTFIDLISSIIAIIIISSLFEKILKRKNLIIFFIFTGIFGNLFEILISDIPSQGCYQCIFGLIAGGIAFTIIEWDASPFIHTDFFRRILLVIGLFLLAIMLLCLLSNEVRTANNFFSFFIGIFLGFSVFKPSNSALTKFNRIAKILSTFILLFIFLAFFIGFYLFRKPFKYVEF